jgi:hypothetical protein
VNQDRTFPSQPLGKAELLNPIVTHRTVQHALGVLLKGITVQRTRHRPSHFFLYTQKLILRIDGSQLGP